MPDLKYFACLTEAGAALEAKAIASGKGVVLTHIAIGDANKKEITPAPTVKNLVHEVCRRPIDARSLDENDRAVSLLHATIPADVGGFWVYELGVIGHLEGETEEVLFAYANHAPYYKMLPQAGQMVTHELIIPIIQKTDATLIIEMSDMGYVTRDAYLNPQRVVWNLEADMTANANLIFPDGAYYFAGKSRVELHWLGLKLAKNLDYQEIGTTGSQSSAVKLLFAASEGDEFQVEIFR